MVYVGFALYRTAYFFQNAHKEEQLDSAFEMNLANVTLSPIVFSRGNSSTNFVNIYQGVSTVVSQIAEKKPFYKVFCLPLIGFGRLVLYNLEFKHT